MPAKKPELLKTNGPRATGVGSSYLPVIKLARPLCDICQSPENLKAHWWEDCPHDPYFTWSDVTIPGEKVYEDILDADGNPTMQKKLVRQEPDQEVKERRPNITQVPTSKRHENVPAVREAKWAARGLKRVNEIGVATYCEMRDCWSQDVKTYKDGGIYCSNDHAQLCSADFREKHLEVGNKPINATKRREQLESLNVGVA